MLQLNSSNQTKQWIVSDQVLCHIRMVLLGNYILHNTNTTYVATLY